MTHGHTNIKLIILKVHTHWCFAMPDDSSLEVPKHVTVLIPAVKSDMFNSSILVLLNHDITATGSRGVRISGSNAGYTVLRGSVKSTGYTLHSPVSPSLPLPCVDVCYHITTGVYHSHSGVVYWRARC